MRDAVVETVQMVRRGEKTHEGERSALVYVGIAYEIQESRGGIFLSRPITGVLLEVAAHIICALKYAAQYDAMSKVDEAMLR
ncbi:hypothetical protein PV328_006639 [Microctonus aethiopoides]|uniref:Uncharacterized protein n=1 Tax=Microctonus aethiopoides TaxID=144406 RepID=A0AA39FPI8_9HYME|nr:hypothetical protein PV328_006639 [Microctonus aethiopoides]